MDAGQRRGALSKTIISKRHSAGPAKKPARHLPFPQDKKMVSHNMLTVKIIVMLHDVSLLSSQFFWLRFNGIDLGIPTIM